MAAETSKLRVKIGANEFEGEGSPDWLVAQLETWRELLSSTRSGPQPVPNTEPSVEQGGPDTQDTVTLSRIFSVDHKNKVVSLRVHPGGNQRDADALLLLLVAYAKLLAQTDVLAGSLKEAMAVSGLRINRVDRVIAPHQSSGYVLKGGTGKGGRYRLTNSGEKRALELMQALGS